MYERIYRLLQSQLDPDHRVHLLRSSEDPGLAEFFKIMQAYGATSMEPNGNIYVQIDDARSASKGTWLEEFAHALQFLQYGNIALSVDDEERAMRELEVAECLLKRADRLHLTQGDIDTSKETVQYYEEYRG
jgi:hypothetical protein